MKIIDYTKLTDEELSEVINSTTDYAKIELMKQHLRKRLHEKQKQSKKDDK